MEDRELKTLDYEPITRMHIFLAACYLFNTKINGSYFTPLDEEDVIRDVEHFKFLTEYLPCINI